MDQRHIEEQSLRLLKAFVAEKSSAARKFIIEFAEAAARGGTIRTYPLNDFGRTNSEALVV